MFRLSIFLVFQLSINALATDGLVRVLISKKKTPPAVMVEKNGHFRKRIFSVASHWKSSSRWMSQYINIEGDSLRYQNQEIGRQLRVTYKSGEYYLISLVPIEKYLEGVLPNEMPASWPLAALKSQAVISRSYMYWQMRERSNEVFDVFSTTMDQIYRPTDVHKPVYRNVRKAVLATKDIVLANDNNTIIKSYFHADCGGETSTAKRVWQTADLDPSPVTDTSCKRRQRNHWKLKLNAVSLQNKLSRAVFVPNNYKLKKIIPVYGANSGRADDVLLYYDKFTIKKINANEFRKLIGYGRLKSTLFSVEMLNGVFTFSGKGHGHGVGLCQWGARDLARKGYSFEKILSKYYRRAELTKFPGFQTPSYTKVF